MRFIALGFFFSSIIACVSQDSPKSSQLRLDSLAVVAEGLTSPMGMAVLSTGEVFIAEGGTGADDTSGGIVMMATDGELVRVVTGLPSRRDSGDLAGISLVGFSPDESSLYFSYFEAGALFRVSTTDLKKGQPLNIDKADQRMGALGGVTLTNAFDIAFTEDNRPVVSDASENGIAIETSKGEVQYIHRFDEISIPPTAGTGPIKVDPVPTGLIRQGDEYYVTLTGGCPFPRGVGQVVAVNDEREQRVILRGLNMPIDISEGPDGKLWVLEFAQFTPGASCFDGSGYRPETGRLSQLTKDGQLVTVVDGLSFPTSVLPLEDGTVLVSEVFSGKVFQVSPG